MLQINAHIYVSFTAGNVEPNLISFDSASCRCGPIKDGVAFDTGDGWWVISYEDLMQMAQFATEARSTDNKLLSVECSSE